jgi:hypothetical protein
MGEILFLDNESEMNNTFTVKKKKKLPIQMQENITSSTKNQNWTWGCIFLLGHCLSWAGWIVFQV